MAGEGSLIALGGSRLWGATFEVRVFCVGEMGRVVYGLAQFLIGRMVTKYRESAFRCSWYTRYACDDQLRRRSVTARTPRRATKPRQSLPTCFREHSFQSVLSITKKWTLVPSLLPLRLKIPTLFEPRRSLLIIRSPSPVSRQAVSGSDAWDRSENTRNDVEKRLSARMQPRLPRRIRLQRPK